MLLCFIKPQDIGATHIVGGEMTYRCLGNDFYELTLTVRRDCENGAEDAPFDDPSLYWCIRYIWIITGAFGKCG